MTDIKSAEQLAGEVKGVLDARFNEVKSSLEARQTEMRSSLDARHDEIKSDLDAKHDKVKALAEDALGKAQRGEDLSNATKELADEALVALNEAKARLDEVEQKMARRVADEGVPSFKTIGEQVVADGKLKPGFTYDLTELIKSRNISADVAAELAASLSARLDGEIAALDAATADARFVTALVVAR